MPIKKSYSLIAGLTLMSFATALSANGSNGYWPTGTGLVAPGDSAVAAYTNPAAMSHLTQQELNIQVAVVASEETDNVSSSGLGLSRSQDDSSSLVIPMVFYSRPINERWTFGASLVAPAGFGEDYGSASISRYLVEEWSLVYVALSPSIAYKINEHWSAGFGASVTYAAYEFESAVLNPTGFGDGRFELEADGVALSFFGGLSYAPNESTRFGLIYRSKTDADLEGDPEFGNLSATTEMILDQAGILTREIEVGGTLPSLWAGGISHQFESGIRFATDVALINFSEFVLSEISFLQGTFLGRQPDYDDIFAGSAALTFPVRSQWTAGLGVSYVENPVSASERSLVFRIDRIWMLSAGFEYAGGGNKAYSFTLSYADGGDGKVRSQDLPVVGTLEAKYEDNYSVLFNFAFRWLN